jgi:hypothetical protein
MWLKMMLLSLLMLSACANSPGSGKEGTNLDVGVLIFGDSGFHLDYPRPWDYERPFFTEEEYRVYERQKWLNDKRPPEDYETVPLDRSPVTGNVVPASGMRQVSTAMRTFCRDTASCNFGLMLGDNIYPSGATLGADGFDDASRFKDILTDPYANIVAQPEDYLTYAVLGNHDWFNGREAGFAQIDFLEKAEKFYMDGPFYSVKPPAGNGEIELFVIDTDMVLAKVPVYEAHLNADGSERTSDVVKPPEFIVEPLSDAEQNIVPWLEHALKESTAQWKLVVGHHPLWSSKGEKHQETRALRSLILPMLCRYADVYIAGHAHTLEIHTDNCEVALGAPAEVPLVQIISGAASRQRPVHSSFMRHQAKKYPEHKTLWAEGLLWGFIHMQISEDTAKVTVMSVPDDGSAEISVDFEYELKRRSRWSSE